MNIFQDSTKQLLPPHVENELAQLTTQLNMVGLDIKKMFVLDSDGTLLSTLSLEENFLKASFESLFNRVKADNQVSITKDGQSAYLIGLPLISHANQIDKYLICWTNKVTEQGIVMIRLAMGWLSLSFSNQIQQQTQEARMLLDMQAQVCSQEKSRSAAQEWVNRLSQVLRQTLPDTEISIFYFRVKDKENAMPTWWVTSDTSSAEKGAASLHLATDSANRATLDFNEFITQDYWAHPVLDEGEIIGVIVIKSSQNLVERQKNFVRASASIVGPLLKHWFKSEKGLWSFVKTGYQNQLKKFREPGYLTWKASAALITFALIILLLIPFDEHTSAKVVVEGQKQQIISAPFEGYWAEVLVRPGDFVKEGQLLAKLDTSDLELERTKLTSEQEQASSKLRQAFADDDSSAVQIASAQLRQANAQLNLVEAKLERAHFRAPADGTIIFGDWVDQIGSPIEVGKKLFELAVGSGYRIVLQVPEDDISRVLVDQKGVIRVTGLPNHEFNFVVNRVTSVAAVEDRKNTFRVEAKLLEQNAPLRPGMQGVGKITVAKSNLITIWLRPVTRWLRMKLWTLWW